jgi:hypothetical protein
MMARRVKSIRDELTAADLDAMIAMVQYLFEEAVKVSPAAAMLLGLAKAELITSKMVLSGSVAILNGYHASV